MATKTTPARKARVKNSATTTRKSTAKRPGRKSASSATSTRRPTAKKKTAKKSESSTRKKTPVSKSTKTQRPATKKSSAKKAATRKSSAKTAAKKTAGKSKPKSKALPAPDVVVDPDVLEFIEAIDRFKQSHNRPFPTWSEVLHVVRSLGYRRK